MMMVDKVYGINLVRQQFLLLDRVLARVRIAHLFGFPGTPNPNSARDNRADYSRVVTPPSWGSAFPESGFI